MKKKFNKKSEWQSEEKCHSHNESGFNLGETEEIYDFWRDNAL